MEASVSLGVPLHPSFTYLWHDVNLEDIQLFVEILENDSAVRDDCLELPVTDFAKRFLTDLLCEFDVTDKIKIKNYRSLIAPLGMRVDNSKLISGKKVTGTDALRTINAMAGFPVHPKGLTRIGARMGRPEKAEERKMNPPVHVLFPIGNVQKNRRDLNQYEELQGPEMQMRQCSGCGNISFRNVCEKCGSHTNPTERMKEFDISISEILRNKVEQLGVSMPKKVNGVRGLTSTHKTPEPIEKGILRASNSVYPFKDGTCRFDMSDVPLTHARLDEIGLTPERAKSLGYSRDYRGAELVDDSQIIEIYPQDVVPSKRAGEYLLRVSNFVDDLLQKFYGLEPFYRARSKEDLIGSLVIGLAPHTSGGILGRIIGYTDGSVCYAHPFFHAAKRRNCDGDEDSIMLLLDGLLNFSLDYLPNSRGSLMDAPLVLSLRINPTEIDKEALNLDITGEYPYELLEMTMKFPDPSEITKYVVTAGSRVKKGEMFPHCDFSDDTTSINLGTLESSYKTIPSMEQKLELTLELGRKIRAVDASDMAERILKSHFIPDIMGNLNKFGSQTFRCTSCNHIYRRLPITGKCRKCGTKLIGTVHRGNITKYLETSYKITNQYEVSNYVRQRIRIMRESVNSIFEARDNNFKTLEDFDDT